MNDGYDVPFWPAVVDHVESAALLIEYLLDLLKKNGIEVSDVIDSE